MTLHARSVAPGDDPWRGRAHDIKNILAAVALIADELEGAGSDRTRQLGRRLERSCDRILQICHGPAGFGRAAHGPTVSLDTVFGDVIDILDGLDVPGIRIASHGPAPALPEATGAALFRILANLGTNAVTAMHGTGGRLDFVCAAEAGALRIDIVDTGPGMGAAPDLAPGTGLPVRSGQGLSIARRLAEEAGGTLTLRRTGLGGTTFRVALPLPDASARCRIVKDARAC